MGTMTLAISEDLKSRMEAFPEMNWSAVARSAFDDKLKDLEFIKKFKSKSTLTDDDAIKLGRELNARMASRRRS